MASLTPDAIQSFLAEHDGWSEVDGAFERTFETEDYYGAHDLAHRLAFHAEDVDHHPDLEIGYKSLKVRLRSHDVGALTERDTEFVEWIDEFIRFRDAAKLYRDPRPAQALVALFLEGVDRFVKAVDAVAADDLEKPVRTGDARSVFGLAMQSSVASCFESLGWVRDKLHKPANEHATPRSEVDKVTTLDELRPFFDTLRKDFEETVSKLGAGEMNDRAYLTPDGKALDAEMMLERTILTLERGRHMIEAFLASQTQ
jgi:4a-hydroxytetrahydrobiopterin dehydratase